MRKRFSLLFLVSQSQRFQERFRFPNRKLDTNGKQLAFNFFSSQMFNFYVLNLVRNFPLPLHFEHSFIFFHLTFLLYKILLCVLFWDLCMEIISIIKMTFFDIQKHPRGSTDFSIHGCSKKMKTITSTTNRPVSGGLSYVENEGMFCVLCRSHNTVSPTNGDRTWNSKPCV